MRSHGWGGNAPASDEEAILRILDKADEIIAEHGSAMRIADVARELAVTRQTVYRYFPGTEALLVACAMRSADGFLDQLAAHLRGYTDPAAALVEGAAFAVETLADDTTVQFLFSQRKPGGAMTSLTSDTARTFSRAMLHRIDVDWAAHGFDDDAVETVAEFGLRSVHSLLLDPGDPPRSGAELRSFLGSWLGPSILYPQMQRAMTALAPLTAKPRRKRASRS